MKIHHVLQILLVTLAASCASVENEKVPAENERSAKGSKKVKIDCLEVSLVSGICGVAVLKIEDSRFTQYGESWNGHSNVFFGQMDCSFTEPLPNEKKFFISISTDQLELDFSCAQCLATVDYQGSKKYFISKVDGCDGK
jgi:hypothetical protein